MLHAPERLHLEERGAGSGASSVHRPGHGVLDRQHVVSVDHLARHAVPRRAVGEILDRALRAPVGRERELVVLADEDDRQPPRRRQVHALVRCALADRSVAEEGKRDLAGPAKGRTERRAAGVRDAGPDDPVAAEDVE